MFWLKLMKNYQLPPSTQLHPSNGPPAIRNLNGQSLVGCWWPGYVLWRPFGSWVIKREQYFVSKYGSSISFNLYHVSPGKGLETHCFSYVSICLSAVTKLFRLYYLITVSDISTKLHTLVMHNQTTCLAQEA